MRRFRWMFLICAVLLACVIFACSGFNPREDVYLADYTVSPDGTQITMRVGVASSMGYTRGYRAQMGGFNQYLTFYTAFGGFNSSLGARDTFMLEIDPINCDEIYFYHGGGGYTLVLQKDPLTGQWHDPE